LRGLKGDPHNNLVEADYQEMYTIISEQNKVGQGGWLECFTGSSGIPRVVYRTFLGLAVHFLQQWTGVNYFFYVS
jgi:SP family sugar:H+ symporter-like MFS transporter